MHFSKLVVAAFVALAQYVTAAPVDARTNRQPVVPVIKGNDRNVIVIGNAKGGNGGTNTANNGNLAIPIVKAYGNSGKIFQDVAQGNAVEQYADGGSPVVAGVIKSRDLEERGRTSFPSFPVFKDNDGNVFVVGQATGGNGGKNEANNANYALPVAAVGSNKGKISQGVQQGNSVYQSADGGSPIIAGKYTARDVEDEDEDDEASLEARGFTFPSFYDNDRNVVVYGIATGGNGGTNTATNKNLAAPVVFAGKNNGKISQGVAQQNYVEQYADGGSPAVIGKSSKRAEDLEARSRQGQGSLIYVGPVLSDNDGNTLVKGDATGGRGGTNKANNINAAVPIALVAGKNSGKIQQGVGQSNEVGQSANGGSPAIIGKQQ